MINLQSFLKGLGMVVGLALVIGLVRSYQLQHPTCTVSPADCVLCGTKNELQGTDTIAFFHCGQGWRKGNLSMENPPPPSSPFADDFAFEPDERVQSIYVYHLDAEKRGSFGTVEVDREAGLIVGALTLGREPAADLQRLADTLCPSCYEKVAPATRNVNCFLYDCLTGKVYSLYESREWFSIRDNEVHILCHTKDAAAFLIKMSIDTYETGAGE